MRLSLGRRERGTACESHGERGVGGIGLHNVTSVAALAAVVTLWGLWTFNVTSGAFGFADVTL